MCQIRDHALWGHQDNNMDLVLNASEFSGSDDDLNDPSVMRTFQDDVVVLFE